MKRTAPVPFLILLQTPVLSLLAAEPAKECSLCAGVIEPGGPPATIVPDIEEVALDGLLQFAPRIDLFTPEQRRQTTVIFSYSADPSRDQLQQVETATRR